MSDTQATSRGGASKTTEEDSLLDQILQETRMKPSDEGYDVAKSGVEAFLSELLQPRYADEKVNSSVVDQMLAQIDQRLSRQLDEILHHPDVQHLESAWRSLKYVVDHTDFRQNIKVEMLNVSKDQLLEDFEDAPEIVKSGLYKHVYTDEYGQFGGQPVGAMVANYQFGPAAPDIKLLQNMASVGAMAHAPILTGTSPKMFGVDSFEELPKLKDLQSIFEGPQYAKWQGFRESEDSRYIGMTAPRFLLRLPYGGENNPVKAFDYQEDVSGSTIARSLGIASLWLTALIM